MPTIGKLLAVDLVTNHLNLNSLPVFSMAARHCNFQRAAEALNLSHGAVSQRVNQLESDLGFALFDRKPRGVKLTEKGRGFYASVEEALDILASATSDLEQSVHNVTLHIGDSTATKWLLPRLAAFNAQYPDITLKTEIQNSLPARKLGRNEIALGPGTTPGATAAHHVRSLCEVRLVAVCSPNFLRPDWPLDFKSLLTFPLLQDGHRRWERRIEKEGLGGEATILNFGRSALALDAAIQGHGIAIAPTFLTSADVSVGRLVEIWHDTTPSGEQYFLHWAKQYASDNALMLTIDWLLDQFGVADGQSH